ncbi:hypothetical protein RV10_GL000434 [Enterococcus pallens]|nr:hypothetical protein RV10_GL000434 [Enterococcus pallens]
MNNREKRDNNYHIARAMLDHFDQIPKITIYDLSELCFVSTAAISRFIRQLGFSTFTAFKEACAEKIDITNDYSSKYNAAAPDVYPTFVKQFTENIQDNVQIIANQLDFEQFLRINEYIHQSKDVGVFGLEFASFLAQHFQIKMAELNKYTRIGLTKEEQLTAAQEMAEGSTVLIFSLEGGYFYYNEKILDILKEKKTKIIVFTLNKTAMIERTADEIVLCGTHNENTEGRLSILYIMELLIYQYFLHYHH